MAERNTTLICAGMTIRAALSVVAEFAESQLVTENILCRQTLPVEIVCVPPDISTNMSLLTKRLFLKFFSNIKRVGAFPLRPFLISWKSHPLIRVTS